MPDNSSSPARTIFAVLLGYLAFIVLGVIGILIAASMLRAAGGLSMLIAGELVTFIAGLIAGAITARVARTRAVAHAGGLGLAIFLVTALKAFIAHPIANSPYPAWYPYAAAVFGGIGAFVGGALTAASESRTTV